MTSASKPLTVYGIVNCTTVKKARAWLDAQDQTVQFHDFKKQGISAELLQQWLAQHSWETLVNRKGTTWRQLDPAQQARVTDAASAQALMQDKPSVIKRPVIAWPSGTITVGFDEAKLQAQL